MIPPVGRRRKTLIVAITGVLIAGLTAGAVLTPGSPVRFALSAVVQYEDCYYTMTPHGVIGLGDSITAGHHQDWIRLGATDSYFDVLACSASIDATANAGVWMQTTSQIRERVPDVIARKPETVFLLAGTNDIRTGQTVGTIANVEAIISELDHAGIRVILGMLPPSDDYPDQTIAMNAALSAWAAAHGVAIFDAHDALADKDGTFAAGMSEDGIHPSRDGARVLAAAALSAYSSR